MLITDKGLSGDLKFKIRDNEHVYLLRCYLNKCENDILPIIRLTNILAEKKFPVPHNFKNKFSQLTTSTPMGTWALTEFVEGFCPPEPNALTPTQLIEAAKCLGVFHKLSNEYTNQHPIAPSSFGHLDINSYLLYFSKIEKYFEHQKLSDFDLMMQRVILKKKELLERFSKSANTQLANLPRLFIHGDYHASNLLFNANETIASVLDWQFSMPWTRAGEVHATICMMCKKKNLESFNAEIDFSKAKRFLHEYEKIYPLNAAEKAAMSTIAKLDAFRIDYLLDKRYPIHDFKYDHLFMNDYNSWFWWDENASLYEKNVIID